MVEFFISGVMWKITTILLLVIFYKIALKLDKDFDRLLI